MPPDELITITNQTPGIGWDVGVDVPFVLREIRGQPTCGLNYNPLIGSSGRIIFEIGGHNLYLIPLCFNNMGIIRQKRWKELGL